MTNYSNNVIFNIQFEMHCFIILFCFVLDVVPLAGTIIMSNRVKKVKLENQKSLSADTIENATRQRSELMTKITQRLSQKFDKKSPQKIKKKSK